MCSLIMLQKIRVGRRPTRIFAVSHQVVEMTKYAKIPISNSR